MKKIPKIIAGTLILMLCMSSFSFAASDERNANSPKEKILFQEAQITDPVQLLERAKNNIQDDKNSEFSFKIDDNLKVLNEYHTSQLLEKKSVGDAIEETYAATGIIEVAATDKSIGSQYQVSHFLVYNTIYYTTGTGTDYQGNSTHYATFTKGSGQITTYDGAAFSNAKITFYQMGMEFATGRGVSPTKSYTLGTATSYSKATGFTALFNEFDYADAPVYSVRTAIPWTRGGTSGTATVTYVYVVGNPEGEWFED